MAIASETGNEASAASGEMCAAIDHAVSISKYVAIRGDDINHRRYVLPEMNSSLVGTSLSGGIPSGGTGGKDWV